MPRDLAGRLDHCSINTATLGYQEPIASTIDAVARAGYGALCPWRRELVGENIGKMARRIRDAGLRVSGYCRSTYIPGANRAAFLENLADNQRAVDEAATLGADSFVMVVGSLPTGSRNLPDARAQLAEGAASLFEYAKTVGVRLSLEPLHPMYAADRSCLCTLEQALDLAADIEPEPHVETRLGIVVDAYHVWWDPKVAAQIARAGAQGRLFGFHVSDWLVPTRDLLTDRGMMGDGVIDLSGLRGMVEDAGYRGYVEVEIFSSFDWWKRPPADTLAICADRLQNAC